jgi:hypothetical protein
MKARFAGRCRECGGAVDVGDDVRWLGRGKGVVHAAFDCTGEDNRTWKQRYGRCEDAPCCGCCGPNLYGGGWD